MERRTAIGAAIGAGLAAVGAVVAGALSLGGGSKDAASPTSTTTTRRTTTSRAEATSTTKAPGQRTTSTTTSTPAAGGNGAGGPATTPAPSTTTSQPQAVLVWPQLARVDDLAVGSSKAFTFRGPSSFSGFPGILLRTGSASFEAYGPCTHAYGQLRLQGGELVCELHGSRFSPSDGSVLGGPASTPVSQVVLSVSNGVVSYVRDA